MVSALRLVVCKLGRGAKRKALHGGNLMVVLLLVVGVFSHFGLSKSNNYIEFVLH